MKNIYIRTRILIMGALYVAAPLAYAIPVECVNCSTIFLQAEQMAKEIEMAITATQQLQTQMQQYQNMLTQGRSLPNSRFNQLTADFQRLQALYQQSNTLAGNLNGFDQQFRNQFGGYNDYLSRTGQSPDYMQHYYEQWANQGFDSMRVAMQASGQNMTEIDNEDAMLAQLVARSHNAQGRMQAIQAGNEIAAQQVQQLQKLREMFNAQIQSQSLWYASNIERQTLDDAFRQKYRSAPIQHSSAKEY